MVRIQSSENFYHTFVYCQLWLKDENEEKEVRKGPFFKKEMPLGLPKLWHTYLHNHALSER